MKSEFHHSAAERRRFKRQYVYACFLVFSLVALGTSAKYILSGGTRPVQLLYFAASGLLGTRAFDGTIAMALVGVGVHLLVSVIWVSFFFLLFSQYRMRITNRILAPLLIGVFMWCSMFFVIMSLSKSPPVPFEIRGAVIDIMILILCAGVPITYMGRKWLTARQ